MATRLAGKNGRVRKRDLASVKRRVETLEVVTSAHGRRLTTLERAVGVKRPQLKRP